MEENVNPVNAVPINNDTPAAIAQPITRDLDSIKFTIATPHTYDSIYKSWFAAYERLTKPRNTHLRAMLPGGEGVLVISNRNPQICREGFLGHG